MTKEKLEGSVDELYGYLVCAGRSGGISVYVWADKNSNDVTRRKADMLARKIKNINSPQKNEVRAPVR